MSEAKTITLQSGDNQLFYVHLPVAMEFKAVKTFFEENTDPSADAIILLPNVFAEQLGKIIDYCSDHLSFEARGPAALNEREAFDANFIGQETDDGLKQLVQATHHLNIKYLLDLLLNAVANKLKNKSVEYVRSFLGIKGDFTGEEEAKYKEENAWAFEEVDPDNV